MPANAPANLSDNIPGNLPASLPANMPVNLPANVPAGVLANVPPAMLANVPPEILANLSTTMTPEMLSKIPPEALASIPPDKLPPDVTPDMLATLAAMKQQQHQQPGQGAAGASQGNPGAAGAAGLPQIPKMPDFSGLTNLSFPPMPSASLPQMPQNLSLFGFDVAIPKFINKMKKFKRTITKKHLVGEVNPWNTARVSKVASPSVFELPEISGQVDGVTPRHSPFVLAFAKPSPPIGYSLSRKGKRCGVRRKGGLANVNKGCKNRCRVNADAEDDGDFDTDDGDAHHDCVDQVVDDAVRDDIILPESATAPLQDPGHASDLLLLGLMRMFPSPKKDSTEAGVEPGSTQAVRVKPLAIEPSVVVGVDSPSQATAREPTVFVLSDSPGATVANEDDNTMHTRDGDDSETKSDSSRKEEDLSSPAPPLGKNP
ncbi:hypothetical protein ZWY2020_024802 [Hordeum vulgare]|nr:hypothetical protein ZWY2020_024802 [Hordeum vulgare]